MASSPASPKARGDQAEAERQHRIADRPAAETDYPGSSALISAKGRLAGYYARTGRAEPALALFREIVAANVDSGDSSPGLRRALEPYFELLVRPDAGPDAVADLFTASQILVRPGVAQTQAVLARELSGGSDEAARMFRQSVTLTRDIERGRVELARLEAQRRADAPPATARIAELRTSIGQWQQDQVAMQARLAQFPRYRAVSSGALQLADLQAPAPARRGLLQDARRWATVLMRSSPPRGGARAFRIGATPRELDRQVDALRATISVVENNQQLTYPFDLELRLRALSGAVRAGRGRNRPRSPISSSSPTARCCGCRPTCWSWIAPAIDAYRARTAADPERRRLRFPRRQVAGARPRHLHRGLGPRLPRRPPGAAEPRPRRISRLRRRTRRRAAIICRRGGTRGGVGAGRLHLVARRLEPADLGARAGRGRRGGGRGPRRRGRDRHRRRLHRHRDHRPRRPQPISHPPFRHPWPGDAAAARMPGAARSADQLRRRRFGRAAHLLARFST